MHDSSQISRRGHRILLGGRSLAAQSGVPLVMALGVICQLVDSRAYQNHTMSPEIHALFGLLLCAVVFTHFYNGVKCAHLSSPQDIARLSRNLSRKVYLLMYLLLGLRIVLGMKRPLPQAADGFRDYLICGVFALVLIRMLAARQLRASRFTQLESRPHAESL